MKTLKARRILVTSLIFLCTWRFPYTRTIIRSGIR